MEKKFILALDQGTTSSRAIVFDKHGEIQGSAQQEFPQIYPHTGWVEHDPIEILGSQVGVISEALIRAKTTAKEIAAEIKNAYGTDIDRRKMNVADIKQFGEYTAEIKLYSGVTAKITVIVKE